MNSKSRWMEIAAVFVAAFLALCAVGSITAQAATPDGTKRTEVVSLVRQTIRQELQKTTGWSIQNLKQALRSGKTLSEIISGSGHSVNDFKAAVKVDIQNLVATQQLSQTQADRISTRLDSLINRRFGQNAAKY